MSGPGENNTIFIFCTHFCVAGINWFNFTQLALQVSDLHQWQITLFGAVNSKCGPK